MDKIRCAWSVNDSLYQKYHDEEWGKLVTEDNVLFEFMVLESFQAGLSWITILKKRENFRKAFDNFDYQKIAIYDQTKIDELLQNQGIVRNKLKILATISNAKHFIATQKEFGSFYNYLLIFTKGEIIVNHWTDYKNAPSTTKLSDSISKDLKKRGFKFFGSTVVYAFLQATGFVDDHVSTCWIRTEKAKS